VPGRLSFFLFLFFFKFHFPENGFEMKSDAFDDVPKPFGVGHHVAIHHTSRRWTLGQHTKSQLAV
jgi:hypothetical protein